MNRITAFTIIAFITLSMTACVSSNTFLYRGEMEIVAVYGDDCSDSAKPGSRIPLELVLKQNSSNEGYFSGKNIQSGRFSGDVMSSLQVVYPNEFAVASQGHALTLSRTPDGINGELNEKRQESSTSCFFEKSILRLKYVTNRSEANTIFDRQRKLYSATDHYARGEALLIANDPEAAIQDFLKSLKLRSEVDRKSPLKAYPYVAIAIANVMANRESEALKLMRKLFEEKLDVAMDTLKLRLNVSDKLCEGAKLTRADARQKASVVLMNAVASEFGHLNGIGNMLVNCYNELGQQEDDPANSLGYYEIANKLWPENANSIIGIVMAHLARFNPAEGRIFLIKNSATIISELGQADYNIFLSYLYSAEAQLAEKSGNLLNAEELSREAVKVDPKEYALIIKLTRVLGRSAKYEEARKLLEEGEKGCNDESCRKEYADERVRQERVESIIKRMQ